MQEAIEDAERRKKALLTDHPKLGGGLGGGVFRGRG